MWGHSSVLEMDTHGRKTHPAVPQGREHRGAPPAGTRVAVKEMHSELHSL